MRRQLEPEVMADPAEARLYDAMDHGGVNQQFVDDLLAVGPVAGEWLDLGTGPAHIPIALCQRPVEVRLMAVDLSEAMLDVAYCQVELAGLRDQILLALEDAKALSFADGRFAGLLSNSLMHHLPDPAPAFAEAIRVVAAGGRLFVRDLLRPGSEAEVGQLVESYTSSETARAQQLFADSLRAALRIEEVQKFVGAYGCPPHSVQQTSDRHWTWQWQKPAL